MNTAAATAPPSGRAAGRRTRPQTPRYWEMDALRGLAVVTMVVYHLLWDLWFLRVLPDIVLWEGFWKYFQRATASTFILLAGASMAILTQRTRAGGAEEQVLVRRFQLRGAKIFALGMALTVVIALSGIGRLDFGILHMLGFSMVLATPLRRLGWVNVGLWLAFFVAGFLMQPVDVSFLWLVPLGLAPSHYAPLDYFPLVPWFGALLLGIGLTNLLYTSDGRRFTLSDWSARVPVVLLRLLGQHSLVLYLVHQPVLWAVLALLGIVRL